MNNKTIAQFLGITEFPYRIKNNNGNVIYHEKSDGNWFKHEFDSNGRTIYREQSTGFWDKREYDLNANVIYYENSTGFWCKYEYDLNGNEIYYEDSDGVIRDNRPKVIELTLEQIAEKFGIDVNNIKIKK